MMTDDCKWTEVTEGAETVLFTCQCGASVAFVKPGLGEPAAIKNDDGTWSAPETAWESVADRCTAE